jgi:uncharacterized protein YbaR (Trm112 family)
VDPLRLIHPAAENAARMTGAAICIWQTWSTLIKRAFRGNLRDSQFGKEASKVKKELMDILACPMCKGDLKLTIVEEDKKEVLTGSLYCAKCNETYPIVDAIPNLLPPDLRDKTNQSSSKK